MNIKGLLSSVLLLSWVVSGVVQAATNDVKFGAVADWVSVHEVVLPEKLPLDNIEGGVYYALIDSQVRVPAKGRPEHYSRFSELVVNQQGLDSVSQINIVYDPTYEELTLNSLNVRRNGTVIDKRSSAKFSVIQRETRLESLLYDGRLTVNIIIDDVRVGDIVEYSHTIKGANPVYKNIFGYESYLEWSVPVYKQNIRILWGKSVPLQIEKVNTDVTVKESPYGNFRQYVVEVNDSRPRYINTQAPEWYDPYGMIFFSESGSWSDIVAWALPLYANAVDTGPEIKKVADSILGEYHEPEQQIVEALKFVQSEIRYLGIEIGSNSHTPSPARETLQRRYGDCKDKTVLFISLLKLLGIDARPALVNTNKTRHLAVFPPIIDAFNHVLVKVTYRDAVYWLDPTRQYQLGKLSDIYQPDYGYALVIDKATVELDSMKQEGGLSKTVIYDSFDLRKGIDNEAIFASTTQYYGKSAERQRHQLASEGLNNLRDQYAEFYSRYYSAVDAINPLEISVDDATGVVESREKYLLKKFWIANDENNSSSGIFYANAITPYFEKPEQVKRNSPYEIVYPLVIEHNIDVAFGEEKWSFDDEAGVEDNKFFSYTWSSQFDKEAGILKLGYIYQAKVDHVAVDELDAYLAAMARAKDNSEFYITYNKAVAAQSRAQESDGLIGVIILLAVVVYVAGFMFVIINWRMDANKQPEFPEDVYYPVSIPKFLILSVLTFGIYLVYWFYRNWLYKKKADQSSIMPIARGIFSIFWYYPLYASLVKDSVGRFQKNMVLEKSLAIAFAILYLLIGVASNMDKIWLLAVVMMPLFLMPHVNYINHINEGRQQGFHYNSRWLARHTVLAILLMPLIVLVAGKDLGLLPGDKVIKGDDLMAHDIKFMQRNGIIEPGEKIIYFYSDAFINIREDGNGFTDNRVFSYWKDDGVFNYESEEFGKIKDIKVTYPDSKFGNTVISIKKEDDKDMVLYVSQEQGLDKKFVDELKMRWGGAKK